MPQAQPKPWEKYQAEAGPWLKYAQPAPLLTSPTLESGRESIAAQKEAALAEKSPVTRLLFQPADWAMKARDWLTKKVEKRTSEASELPEPLRGPGAFMASYPLEVGKTLLSQVSPGGVAMAAASAVPAARPALLALSPVFAAQGAEEATRPREEWESQADVLERRLGGAGQMVGGVTGTVAGARAAARRLGPAAARIGLRRPAVVQSVVKQAMALPPGAVNGAEDIFRASAPTGKQVGFRENLYAAAGDLAEVGRKLDLSKARGGVANPEMRPRATVKALDGYLKEMFETERAPQIERHGMREVATNLSADAIEGVNHVARTGGTTEIRALAEKMKTAPTATIGELDQLARTVNQELISYEQMSKQARTQARITNRKLGSLKALDRALSDSINAELTGRGEVGLVNYERRFAALSQIRNQLQARMTAVELQRSSMPGRMARATLGGKYGVASASQAAIADVNIGKLLEKGFAQLAKTKLQPNKGTAGSATLPETPTPPETPPVRGLLPAPSATQLPPAGAPPASAPPTPLRPTPVDVSAAGNVAWPRQMSIQDLKAQAIRLREASRMMQEKAATALDPQKRQALQKVADSQAAKAAEIEEQMRARTAAIEEKQAPPKAAEVPKEAPKPAKPEWMMTPEEWGDLPANRQMMGRGGMSMYQAMIRRAIAEGKAVPEEMVRRFGEPKPSEALQRPPSETLNAMAQGKTPTYDALPEQIKAAIDSELEGLPHLPKALREARVKELAKYGEKGSPRREKIAKEYRKKFAAEIEHIERGKATGMPLRMSRRDIQELGGAPGIRAKADRVQAAIESKIGESALKLTWLPDGRYRIKGIAGTFPTVESAQSYLRKYNEANGTNYHLLR